MADASHELRTRVAVVRTTTQVTLARDVRTADEYRKLSQRRRHRDLRYTVGQDGTRPGGEGTKEGQKITMMVETGRSDFVAEVRHEHAPAVYS
jgi:hypothetical protein